MTIATGNTAPALTSLTIFCFCWAVITFALRLWVKAPKRTFLGLDDLVIGFALLAALGNVVATGYAINHGFGVAWPSLSNPSTVEKALFAGQLTYVAAMGGELTRFSNSLFTARFIAHSKLNTQMANVVVALYIAWTIASLLAVAIRSPFQSPWQNRNGSRSLFVRWTTVESVGCLLDLVGVTLSTYFLWTLQMSLKRKLSSAAIFASRLLIWPVLACRVWQLSPSSQGSDTGSPNITAEILTQIAMTTALNLASVTCITPFLRPFQNAGYMPGSSKGTSVGYGITGANRSRHEAYLMLGTKGTTKNKDGSIVLTSTDKGLDYVKHGQDSGRTRLRTDPAYSETAVEVLTTGVHTGIGTLD